MNPLISRACAKEPLKFKIKCDSLEVVNPLIEISNAVPERVNLLLSVPEELSFFMKQWLNFTLKNLRLPNLCYEMDMLCESTDSNTNTYLSNQRTLGAH